MIEKEINLEKVKLDLEVTLLGDVERNDGVSTLTTEEKMNLFPEINGDKTLLKTLEKSIVSNNEVLKKKNNIPFSYNSTDESSTSQSGTPSTLEATTTETDKIVEPTTQEINSNTVDSESQTQEINTQTIEVEETKLVDETIEETVVEEEVVEEEVVEDVTEDVTTEVTEVPNQDVADMNTFHKGKGTEGLEQAFDDYPTLALYDLYQVPINLKVDKQEKLYDLKDEETINIPGTTAIAQPIVFEPIIAPEINTVDVNVNDILMNHNNNINGENAVDWVPTNERDYGQEELFGTHVLNQRAYGMGLDNKTINYEFDEDGNNVIYIAGQKEDGSIDYENRTILSSFKEGEGEGSVMYSVESLFDDEDKQNIYKGIAYQMHLQGQELTPGAIGYLVDSQYNQYKALVSTHYNNLYSQINKKSLNYEEEFTFEDYKEFLPEAKTNLIKDLISKNIFLPGVIHGNDFEKMVYDNIYQERTNRYVDKVMVDVQELVDDPENYKGVFFPNIDDDDYNVGSVGTTGPFVLYETRAEDIDIFRQAIELELDKDKYDWMGKSDKDMMGGMLTRKWKMTHSDFSSIHSKNEDLEIEKFNEKIETSEIESELEDNENVGEVEPKITFIKPGEVEEVVGAEVAELIKNGMSITDVDIYVNEKYGLNYDNETSSLKFSPKYIKAHGQIYQEINKHTFDEFNELHPEMNNKHLGLEAWEGTVGGMIFGYDNPDYDVKYDWHEENIIIPVLSIVGDPFTYITGGAGGFAGKSMVGMARTRHLQHMKTSVQMLVNTGKYTVQEANILVKANNAKLYNRIIKSEGIVTSGLGLGLYTTTAEIAMHSTENFDDMYVGEVIKNGLVNTALGGGIGHITGLSSRVKTKIDRLFGKNNNQFKTTFNDGLKLELNVPNKISTLNNMGAWTGKRGTDVVALGLESGLFMSAHYDDKKSLAENYRDNVVFLFSLKTAMSTMKLGAKPDGSKMKYKEDFKVNKETLEHINRQFNGTQKFKNSGELYDYLDKEMKGSLTNNKKGELDMNKITELQSILSSLPLDVQYKYLDSRNFSVDMELPDLIPMHMESVTIEGKESIVYSNHKGEVIEVRNAKDIAEISSGEMTTSQYMDKVFETSSRRLTEYGIKEDKYVEDLNKKLKSHNITPTEYQQWFNGTMGKGQKYENLELSKKISNVVNNQFQQKSLETSKVLEDFSSNVLTQSISNLKDRGVENPNARAIANECLSVQNKFFERERAVNSENSRLIEQEINHIETLEKNKHIQGYEHTNENGEIVYTNKPTGKAGERSVTTNITADNKVYIGELLGAELTIGNKSRVINALKESNKLTPELENLINETTTLKELQEIVKEKTNIEALEYKTNDQHLEFLINKENNSTVVLTGEKTIVESREVTSFDVLTSENSEVLLKQATTPAHRQMIEDGLIALQKLSEKGVESKVTMHNSQESFLKVLENDGMTVESNKYAATAYVDKKGNMHFNTKVTREKTDVYHEYQHLELDVLKNKSPEKYKQYIEEVNTLLENEGALAHILAIVDAKDNQGNKIYTVEETSKDGGVSTNLEKTIEYRGEEALIRIAEAVRNGTIDPKSLDAIKNSSILNKMKIKINESLNSLGSSSKLKTSVEVLEYISNHVKDFESTKVTSEKTTTKSTDLETVGEGEGKLKVTEKVSNLTSEKELLETADLETLTSTERTKIENRIKAIDAELDVLKVKETVESTPKRLETLVEELETLKSEGASQEAIDAKFQEINSARVKQAQAELGPEVGETIEARDARELSEITPQEVFNTSRDLLNNTDLKETKTINDVTGLEEVKGYNVETQKLIQNLKEVKFNPESKNVEVLTAEYNNIVKKISNGTATPKEINDSFIKINNLEKGEVIVTNLTSSLEKHGGAIRGLSGLTSGNTNLQGTVIGGTGKIGGIEIKTKEMLDRDLSTLNLSMIEGYLYMEKGGEITKNIIGPIQEAHVEYNLNVRKNTTDWFENTSMKNPIRRKKTMTKMGLLLSQRERNSIDGKNVWLEILEGKDAGGNYDRGYSKKEKTRIQKEYDKLPKLEDGSIDIVKAFEGLSVTERKILETYENMTSELREKQKIVNEINGKDFVDIENYFPHLSKIKFEKGQEVTTKSSNKEFLDELYDGELNTKIKSDRGIERTAEGVLPMEFNLDKVMINLIGETSRDHAYSGTLKKVNSLITSMKGGENADVNLVLTAIQKRFNDSVKLQLHTNNGFISKVGKPLFNVNYATQLISVRRLFFVEPLSESLRMVTTRPREQYPDFFKQIGEGSNRRLKNMLGGDDANIPFNIMERTGSTGLMKANKIGMEYNQPGRLNTMDKANNYLLGMIDRSQINIVWMPAFKAEFKKSGKEFNVKEYKANPDAYFEANARIFKESSRIADRELGKWKNESTIGGKRTNIDILGLTTLETSSEWAPIMTYMSNFGAQEVAMMQKGLKDLVRGDNAETRAQSVREVLGVFSSGVVYGIASGVGYGFQQYYTERKLLENQLGDVGDYDQKEIRRKISTLDAKWEQEYSDMTNPESIKKEMITNGMFLATSKYSQAVKVVLGSSLGVMDNITSSEQFQVLGGNQAVGLDWLEYSKELFSDATYSKIPKNPEDILMNMLPQIEMAWDVFNEDAPQAVLDYISRGEYLADFEEEYKEDINMYNFLSTSLKVALFSVGKALPFQKDIDQTLKSMYNFYGVNIQENRKLINTIKNTSGGQTQEYTGGPDVYTGGPDVYTGGPDQSTAGDLPVIREDEGGKTTTEKNKKTKRNEYGERGTHSLTDKEFDAKYGENFRWWYYSGDELKEKYSQEECKEFLPYKEYNKLFPEDAY